MLTEWSVVPTLAEFLDALDGLAPAVDRLSGLSDPPHKLWFFFALLPRVYCVAVSNPLRSGGGAPLP